MSSHDKDPLQKQDTSSNSSKSSDSEIDEAEEDMGHLKIVESATKEAKDESKPPSREGISTSKLDLLNVPVAGSSGLQKNRQELLNEPVAGPSGLQKEKKVKAKGVEEDVGARMDAGESDTSDVLKQPYRDVVGRFVDEQSSSSRLSLQSSSSRRYDYATDSASTSADVSEIRSEMAGGSREGSVYRDASEDFTKEESPSYVSALERQPSSETSDTSISEIPPLTSESRSVSISTNTGEQGNRAYIDRLQREANARGSPMSTSSGIRSTDQSELAHQQDWILAGEVGFYRHDVDDPNQDLSDNVAEGGEPLLTSESMEDEPIMDQQMQHFDRLFDQAQPNVDDRGEMNVLEDESGASASRSQLEGAVQASGKVGSPCKRRRPPKCPSDSVLSEMEALENPRPKHKPISGKKSKMASSKSCPVLHSRSESPEPKSSSSEELHRKESPDIKSSSGAQEISKIRRSERMLRRRQHAMSSMDPVIVEEENRTSPFMERDRGSMEIEDPTPETIPEKGGEEAAETSEAKPSTESTDQAYGSETDGTLKEHEESLEFERSVGKSKREPKLSNSPPSDEKPESSAPKAATSRPKKRARSEKMPGKQRRARQDSGGNVPKSVGLGNVKQGESTSSPDISDYTPSDDEKDTQS